MDSRLIRWHCLSQDDSELPDTKVLSKMVRASVCWRLVRETGLMTSASRVTRDLPIGKVPLFIVAIMPVALA